MKRIVNLRMQGRWGNQCFQYVYARKYCELYDCELRTERWIGHDLFELPYNPITERFPIVRTELSVVPGETRFEFRSYFQMQQAMIYTQDDIWRWFQWRPEVAGILGHRDDTILAHLRRGDYFGYGYPVVSVESYHRACRKFGLPSDEMRFISEENPSTGYDPEFVTDFWRLTNTPILLRANSSFSWWAAAMSKNQRVFSPVITDDAKGGSENECEFVEGNWPRLTNNKDFVSDIHLYATHDR